MPHLDPMVLKLALAPWEAALYLIAFVYYLRAWSKIAQAGGMEGGEAALGWRHGAQAISISAAATLIALALMAATLLGLAGGITVDLLPKGMSALQVIVLIGAFDAVVATGAAAVSVAVTPRWMHLEDQLRDRAVLMRLMTARSWLMFALIRLVMAAALFTVDPAAGMTRVTGAGGPPAGTAAMAERLAGMEKRLDAIAKVELPALTLKLDEAARGMKAAAEAGRRAQAGPEKALAPEAAGLTAAVDKLRAEIVQAPAGGMVRSAALGPSVSGLVESYLNVMEADTGSADSAKAETVRALLGLVEGIAGRMGVKAPAMAMGAAPAELPAAVTFSFASGVKTVPAETDAGQPLAQALDGLAAFIRRHPACLVMVEGHADAKGRDDANLMLSLERAESAARPLVDKLDAGHVVAVPKGESAPLVKTKDGADNPKNRRVEIGVRCPGPLKAPGTAGKKMAAAAAN